MSTTVKSKSALKKTVSEAQLRAAINKLGKTQEKIIQSLNEAQAAGIPRDAHKCAVAVYLKKQFPKEKFVGVNHSEIIVNGAKIGTPKLIADFIKTYDRVEDYTDNSINYFIKTSIITVQNKVKYLKRFVTIQKALLPLIKDKTRAKRAQRAIDISEKFLKAY